MSLLLNAVTSIFTDAVAVGIVETIPNIKFGSVRLYNVSWYVPFRIKDLRSTYVTRPCSSKGHAPRFSFYFIHCINHFKVVSKSFLSYLLTSGNASTFSMKQAWRCFLRLWWPLAVLTRCRKPLICVLGCTWFSSRPNRTRLYGAGV